MNPFSAKDVEFEMSPTPRARAQSHEPLVYEADGKKWMKFRDPL